MTLNYYLKGEKLYQIGDEATTLFVVFSVVPSVNFSNAKDVLKKPSFVVQIGVGKEECQGHDRNG